MSLNLPIIFHPEIVSSFNTLIKQNRLPPSLLLQGAQYSGRTTVAVEIARMLHCHHTSALFCGCNQCSRIASYQHPSITIVGTSYCAEEITIAAHVLGTKKDLDSYHHLKRLVLRLIRHCDHHIANTTPNITSKAQAIIDSLATLNTALHDSSSAQPKESVDALLEEVRALTGLLPLKVSVESIRKVIRWVNIEDAEGHKIVILEEVDQYSDSVLNALLKLLEETPPKATIILTTQNRAALPLTVRSRLTYYTIPIPSVETQQTLLNTLGAPPITSSIADYFLQSYAQNNEVEKVVHYIIQSVESHTSVTPDSNIEKICSQLTQPAVTKVILAINSYFATKWHHNTSPFTTQIVDEIYRATLECHHASTLNIPFDHQVYSLIGTLRKGYEFISQ